MDGGTAPIGKQTDIKKWSMEYVTLSNGVKMPQLGQQTVAKEWVDKYGVQIEAWAPFGEGRGGLRVSMTARRRRKTGKFL